MAAARASRGDARSRSLSIYEPDRGETVRINRWKAFPVREFSLESGHPAPLRVSFFFLPSVDIGEMRRCLREEFKGKGLTFVSATERCAFVRDSDAFAEIVLSSKYAEVEQSV